MGYTYFLYNGSSVPWIIRLDNKMEPPFCYLLISVNNICFFFTNSLETTSLQICIIILGLHTHIILPSPFIIHFFCVCHLGSFPVVTVYTIVSTHENEINSWPQTWCLLQTEFLPSSLPWFAQVCLCLAYGCVFITFSSGHN